MSLLLYTAVKAELCTIIKLRQLRTVHQRHLRRIVEIKSDVYINNEEVLSRAGVEAIEIKLEFVCDN